MLKRLVWTEVEGSRVYSEDGRMFAEIERDPGPVNPREEYDNLGTLVVSPYCRIPGDEVAELGEWSPPKDSVYLVVYALRHGCTLLSTEPFNDGYDSGVIGVIYALRSDAVRINGDTPVDDDHIRQWLKSEIEEYSRYLNGDVWMATIYKVPDEVRELDDYDITDVPTHMCERTDSCGGFSSFEEARKYALEQM